MSNLIIKTHGGDRFEEVAKKAKALAEAKDRVVEFDFNDIKCLVSKDTDLEFLFRDYCNAHLMEWKQVGDKCKMEYDVDTEIELYKRKLARAEKRKKDEAAYKEKEQQQKQSLAQRLAGAEMEFKNEEAWNEGRKKNTDGYGSACYDFAEAWAKLMQVEISKGVQVNVCAKSSSREADYMGVTGFMYGCAVSILSDCWKHGEELRKWHNKEYGVAEDKQGVVNPAILTIG